MQSIPLFEHQVRENPAASEAFRIITQLRQAGFVAYLAGGCVRDALLGKTPKDFDVATDATPESVRKTFGKSNTLAFGASFGVIGVLPPKQSTGPSRSAGDSVDSGRGMLAPTEVATFRSDGDYSDGRRPDSVHFGNAQQDALRRDFTINGLFFDPSTQSVIDFVGGQQDLKAGVLRTIRSPDQRFDEDKLRMLRAIRFSSTLGFQIEPQTRQAIIQHASEISVVSGERIGAEMTKVLSSPAAMTGLRLLLETKLAEHMMPDLIRVDLDELGDLIQQLPQPLLVTVIACVGILLDDGKRFVRDVSNLWKLSSEQARRSLSAIQHHATLVNADRLPWSSVQPVMINRDRDDILAVAKSVARAQSCGEAGIRKAVDAATWPAERLNPPPLLTGDDLRQAGISAGPQYRILLQSVRDEQLNGRIQNADQAWQVVNRLQSQD
jgi:tRNA nucleotidyltransferase (CCA-adding enzyme)